MNLETATDILYGGSKASKKLDQRNLDWDLGEASAALKRVHEDLDDRISLRIDPEEIMEIFESARRLADRLKAHGIRKE